MSYSEKMILRTCDCDVYGRWKPSAMMEAMQEIAISHCDSMGLGRGVTDALGVVWVLSRCRVEMKRLPAIGERYTIETYAMPIRHLFFPRAHVFRDEAGEVIGGAHGLWMLMDLETRNTVKHPDVAARMLIEGGVDLKEVNLGSMAHSLGKVVVTNAVAMDQADVECIEKIASMGVKFDVRKVPADNPENFDAIMKKAKSELAAQG